MKRSKIYLSCFQFIMQSLKNKKVYNFIRNEGHEGVEFAFIQTIYSKTNKSFERNNNK